MPRGAEIRLGVGAVDGAAALPQPTGRFGAVVVVGGFGGGHRGHGEEGARLGESSAERARAGGNANEIEEVAVLARGRVHELPGRAGRCEADEERPPPRAVEVAGGPVPALLAALAGDTADTPPRRVRRAPQRRERRRSRCTPRARTATGGAEPVSGDGAHGRPRLMPHGTRPGPGPTGPLGGAATAGAAADRRLSCRSAGSDSGSAARKSPPRAGGTRGGLWGERAENARCGGPSRMGC